MPLKGKALIKPTVNEGHRKAMSCAGALRVAAAISRTEQPGADLHAAITTSALGALRKSDAHRELSALLQSMRRGENPLAKLNSPPTCGPCRGQKSQTHNFFCHGRKQRPPPIELDLRDHLEKGLRLLWSKQQVELQQVRACTIHSCAQPPRAAAARRRCRQTQRQRPASCPASLVCLAACHPHTGQVKRLLTCMHLLRLLLRCEMDLS